MRTEFDELRDRLRSHKENPLTREEWERWAFHKEMPVRREVAGTSSTPSDLLEQLAREGENFHVRRAVLHNRSVPLSVMEGAALGHDYVERELMAVHPGCPARLLVYLTFDVHPSVVSLAKGNLQARHKKVSRLLGLL